MLFKLARAGKKFLAIENSKFRWRNSVPGRHSVATFKTLHNSQIGREVIVMCNGPSLNKVPLDTLAGSFVIGMNKINLLFERSDFRPNLIVAVNKYVIEQNADFFNSTDIPLMISKAGLDFVKPRPNVCFLNSGGYLDFSHKPGAVLFEGWTVTYVALQIAFHMGFQRTGIVGADHNFQQAGKPNELQVSKSDDMNHFDPRYFGTGTPWQLADLEGSEMAYRLARRTYQAHGRALYNCTEGGKLEIFERMPLSQFLHGPEPGQGPVSRSGTN